jgi:hypothetical protein
MTLSTSLVLLHPSLPSLHFVICDEHHLTSTLINNDVLLLSTSLFLGSFIPLSPNQEKERGKNDIKSEGKI